MFPAGAGMNRWEPLSTTTMGNVPRRRGDEPLDAYFESVAIVCSPQARG